MVEVEPVRDCKPDSGASIVASSSLTHVIAWSRTSSIVLLMRISQWYARRERWASTVLGMSFRKHLSKAFRKTYMGGDGPEKVEVEVEGMDEGHVGLGGLGDGYVTFAPTVFHPPNTCPYRSSP